MARKPRLLYLLLSPTFGMHQYTADLANRFTEDFDVHLVTMSNFPEDRYSPQITRHTPLVIRNTGLSSEGLRFRGVAVLKKVIVDLRPDVVHITGPHLWNLALVRHLQAQSIAVIHTIHDLDPHYGMRLALLLRLWNRLILRWADRILVHGELYEQRLLSQGIGPFRVTSAPLLHLFLGYEQMKSLEQQKTIVKYEPMVLFFGRLESYKGVDTLFQAWDFLMKDIDNGSKYSLVLAGPGNLPAAWAEGLPPGVSWREGLVPDDEALHLFRRCSLVVLPYSDGTQSAIVPAAYYFKKPVIVTRVGALPEYVDDGQTGYVIPPNDPSALAKKLKIFMVEPQLAQRLGEAGRKWYDKKRIRETKTIQALYQRNWRKDLN